MPFISEVSSIFIQRFYTGWITLRNQLATPIRTMGRRIIELYDTLLTGNDWEVTPKLSLKRRGGHTFYATINAPADLLYSWKSNTQGTIPIVDTTADVEYINTGGTATVITTKVATSQSSILGIGNYLYIGNQNQQLKWDGPAGQQGLTNWGISLTSAVSTVDFGPTRTGLGVNQFTGPRSWTNPNNVTSTSSYATVTGIPAGNSSAFDYCTQFNFSVPPGNTIQGIQITAEIIDSDLTGPTGFFAQIMKNGVRVGTPKTIIPPSTSAQTITYGDATDLWGTTWAASDITGSVWGVAISAQVFSTGHSTTTFSLRNVQATIFTNGIQPVVPTGSGAFSAVNGYTYVRAYGNSISGEISNASEISNNTLPFTNVAYVGIQCPPSPDPQVNQSRVYRTTDSGGGNEYFEIANSPFPNVGFALTSAANASGGSTVYTGVVTGDFASAIGQNFIVNGFSTSANNGTFPATDATATTITLTNASGVAESHAATAVLLAEDATIDQDLQITSQAEINLGNTPPPQGLINLEWFSGRMWGSTNNLLWASTGPETLSGTAPNSNWNPLFQWVIPGVIVRLIRGPNGLMVMTQDEVYIVRGTDIVNYTVNEFIKNFGIRSYNCVDTDGTYLYVFTSDRQFIAINAAGANDIGMPIADQLGTIDPNVAYVSVNRYGLDSIVRILDTVSNVYFDFNINQQCWQLPGILKMPDCTAMGSIETSPGVWRLLLCSNVLDEDGNFVSATLAYRDITNFQDLGVSYSPVAVFGSIQLAQPGTLAKFGGRGGFVFEYTSAGTVPKLSILPNDTGATLSNIVGAQVTGNFTSLSVGAQATGIPWPPTLGARPANYRSLGYYYSAAKALSAYVRHIQFMLTAPAENEATELVGWGIFGDEKQESGAPGKIPEVQGR